MNRDEFLNRLSELLGDVNDAEREEALKYYRDYFDEAGVINEQNVINELISPENVAETIKQGLGDEVLNDNCDCGGSSFSKERPEAVNAADTYKDRASDAAINGSQESRTAGEACAASYSPGNDKKSDGLSTGAIVAIVIVCIILSPVILSAGGTVLSAAASIIAVLLVITLLIAVCPFILTLCGFAVIVAGVIEFMTNASVGALILGCGFITIGASLLGYVIFWLYFFKLLPGFFRWIAGLGKQKGGKN